MKRLLLTFCVLCVFCGASWAQTATSTETPTATQTPTSSQTPTPTVTPTPVVCCEFLLTCAMPNPDGTCPFGSVGVIGAGCTGRDCMTVTPTPTLTPVQSPITGVPVAGKCTGLNPGAIGRFGQ